jgi:hypothetical protein
MNVRGLLRCIAVLLILLVIVSGMSFVSGSLELFPTEEQDSKARLVSGAALAVFSLLELVVLIWLSRVSRRPIPSSVQ